jgi:hypothetical protein
LHQRFLSISHGLIIPRKNEPSKAILFRRSDLSHQSLSI